MSIEKKRVEPKPDKVDVAHTIIKAGLSSIPFVGGPVAELFSALIVPSLTKRRDEWIQSIAEGLKILEEKIEGFTLESLQNNEEFISTVMHATQIAIRNHQKEKRKALINAVLHVASRNAPNEDLQLMFLNLVDILTTWHLRILCLFQSPETYGKTNNATYVAQIDNITERHVTLHAPAIIMENTFPELQGQSTFYKQVIKDLYDRGLINLDSLDEKPVYSEKTKWTTEMGDQFIKFISSLE